MALLDNIKRFIPFLNSNKRATYNPSLGYLPNVFGTYTGKDVSVDTGLTLSAVYACVKVLAESIAMLPVNIYERMADGDRLLADTHKLYNLVHNQPSKLYTSYTFFENIIKTMSLQGNAYALIVRDRNANINSFRLLDSTKVKIIKENDSIFNNVEGYNDVIPAEDILHFKNMTDQTGCLGLSPIEYASESVGWGLSLQTYGSTYFGNSGFPSGILQTDKSLTTEAIQRLRNSWNNTYSGVDNSNKVAVLEEGVKFNPVSISNESAQFLASRQWSVSEICRWFRVPPHLVADLSKSSFNNIEMQSLEFVQYSLQPIVKRIEQEMNSKIFKTNEKNRFYLEFNLNGLLRGDIKTRADYYTKGITYGFLSINEVRKRENLNSIPNGDEHLIPLNLASLDNEDNAV